MINVLNGYYGTLFELKKTVKRKPRVDCRCFKLFLTICTLVELINWRSSIPVEKCRLLNP